MLLILQSTKLRLFIYIDSLFKYSRSRFIVSAPIFTPTKRKSTIDSFIALYTIRATCWSHKPIFWSFILVNLRSNNGILDAMPLAEASDNFPETLKALSPVFESSKIQSRMLPNGSYCPSLWVTLMNSASARSFLFVMRLAFERTLFTFCIYTEFH